MPRQPGYDTFGPQQPPEYNNEKWVEEALHRQKKRLTKIQHLKISLIKQPKQESKL